MTDIRKLEGKLQKHTQSVLKVECSSTISESHPSTNYRHFTGQVYLRTWKNEIEILMVRFQGKS